VGEWFGVAVRGPALGIGFAPVVGGVHLTLEIPNGAATRAIQPCGLGIGAGDRGDEAKFRPGEFSAGTSGGEHG
jgi:hypothetical protein